MRFEVKLEQNIILPLPTLPGKDEHGVPGNCYREVTAGWGTFSYLKNLLPTFNLGS